jgi:hypothetical protein
MPKESFEAILQVLLSQRPFEVFTVELHGGYRFEVDHPEALVIEEGVATFVVPGNIRLFFGHDTVALIVEATSDYTL